MYEVYSCLRLKARFFMDSDVTKPRGRLIVIEGGEGAGKTTVVKRLVAAMPDTFIPLREPGGTWMGEHIRILLLDPSSKMVPLTEFLLFWASRAQFLIEKVVPILESGKYVLADRYIPSTYAYQIKARKLEEEMALFKALESGMSKYASPALYIFLDIEPELGMKRAERRSKADRMEQEDMSFHNQVYEGYLEFFSTRPHVRIDARRTEDEVFAEVLSAVRKVVLSDATQKV